MAEPAKVMCLQCNTIVEHFDITPGFQNNGAWVSPGETLHCDKCPNCAPHECYIEEDDEYEVDINEVRERGNAAFN